MIDRHAQARHTAAIKRVGVPIQFQRISGFAPNATTATAEVHAVVRTMAPDTTSPAQAGMSVSQPGQLNQDQRFVLLMAQDLCDEGITLPVITGDRIYVPSSGETLNIDRVDPYKRALAGAIELYASAVA